MIWLPRLHPPLLPVSSEMTPILLLNDLVDPTTPPAPSTPPSSQAFKTTVVQCFRWDEKEPVCSSWKLVFLFLQFALWRCHGSHVPTTVHRPSFEVCVSRLSSQGEQPKLHDCLSPRVQNLSLESAWNPLFRKQDLWSGGCASFCVLRQSRSTTTWSKFPIIP